VVGNYETEEVIACKL